VSIVKINAITVPRDRFEEFERRFGSRAGRVSRGLSYCDLTTTARSASSLLGGAQRRTSRRGRQARISPLTMRSTARAGQLGRQARFGRLTCSRAKRRLQTADDHRPLTVGVCVGGRSRATPQARRRRRRPERSTMAPQPDVLPQVARCGSVGVDRESGCFSSGAAVTAAPEKASAFPGREVHGRLMARPASAPAARDLRLRHFRQARGRVAWVGWTRSADQVAERYPLVIGPGAQSLNLPGLGLNGRWTPAPP
jgi:hypothetical protein